MERRPVYFQGCFGWIHVPDGHDRRARTGVVLVPAFGQEEICTHYGMMALADQLASRGMVALRFDYLGVGDSASAEVTMESFAENVRHAAALLQQECPVGPIVLAGLRFGTMVALKAASRVPGLSGVVLMAPTLSGSAFLRETRAAAKMNPLSNLDPVPGADSEQPLNTNGFLWPVALQNEIAAFDAAKMKAPPAPVLMLAARGDRRPAKISAGWRDGGSAVLDRDFPEYEAWMQDPTTSTTPRDAFLSIGDWIAGRLRAKAERADGVEFPSRTLRSETYVETPMMFGKDAASFGILCEPAGKPGAPVAALLLHEGSSHHIGDGGAYVITARRLAAAGIASLRMDLTGMGDSPAGDNPRHPHYDPERIAEAIAGIDVLERAGYCLAVACGLCSGAYTAWQVSLQDKRVVGSALVNLQKFVWHYGDDIRVANRENKRSAKAYMRAMGNTAEWKRVFAGKADVRGTVRVLVKRAASGLFHRVRNMMPLDPNSETALVHRQMRELSKRRTLTNLIFADDDPGLSDVARHFGRGGRKLGAFAPARLHLLPYADHHFNGSSARRRYFDLIEKLMYAAIEEHTQPQVGAARRNIRSGEWRTVTSS